MPSHAESAKMNFFNLATQYYVCGRFAGVAHIMPVAAHLLHHAVEMYLKGALALNLTMPELKKLSHRLTKIWQVFQQHFKNGDVSSLNSVVSALDRFENIRYPESIIKDGMALKGSLFRSTVPSISGAGKFLEHVPEYELILEDIDALVKLIFESARVNPEFFFRTLSEDSRRFLYAHNRHFTA